MKLRTIGMTVVAALALVAGRAQAQDAAAAPAGVDAGWDTKYGVLFTLPNPFGGASGTNVISDYDAKVGFQYNLGATTALRLGVNLSRQAWSREVTTSTTNVETKTVHDPWSSMYLVNLSGEYMLRLSQAAVAPYAGVGAFIDFGLNRKNGTDENDLTPATTEYNNSQTTIGFGLVGKLGLEWRIHKVIALFAEYQAELTLIERSSNKTDEVTTGSPRVESSGSQNRLLNVSTGLANAGKLGIIAFF